MLVFITPQHLHYKLKLMLDVTVLFSSVARQFPQTDTEMGLYDTIQPLKLNLCQNKHDIKSTFKIFYLHHAYCQVIADSMHAAKAPVLS